MIKRFNKLRRNFLWAPEEVANGGKCLVSWKKVCARVELGGLGIKGMEAFGRALRLRWEWFRWTARERPWVGSETPCNQADKELFFACTTISLGDGNTATSWTDKWLNGQEPRSIAPLCFLLATRKNLTVKEALTQGRWMRGLQKINTEVQLDQFIALWNMVRGVYLSEDRDSISWHISADGRYSAKTAYAMQFLGRVRQPELGRVRKVWAEGKVQFFLWLLLQNRNWTAERRRARGLPHDDLCSLCN